MSRLSIVLALVAGLASGIPAVLAAGEFFEGDFDISVSPASAVVSFDNMVPGDSIEGSVMVENSGSIDLRYAITGSATDDDGKGLRDALVLTIEDSAGSELYNGDLDSVDGLLVGDPAAGQQSGDRPLAAGASEELVLRVELPLATDNSVQDAETAATFTFSGEQSGALPEDAADGDDSGSPSVGTGDSGLRGQDGRDSANPIDPLIPLGLFAGGLVMMLGYAGRARRREIAAKANATVDPADLS